MSDEFSAMSAVTELRTKFLTLCGPKSFHDNKKSWLSKGVKAAGITYRMGRALWNNEAKNPCLQTIAKIEAAHARHIERKRQEGTTRDERIEQLEARLLALHSELLALKSVRPDRRTGNVS
jgi:hypothetical protein